jgi:hypothetical protein
VFKQRVQSLQRRSPVRDCVTAQLNLHEHLQHAAENDKPEQLEAFLRPELRRHDQFTGPNYDCRDDQPRPDLPENPAQARRRRLHPMGRLIDDILLSHGS